VTAARNALEASRSQTVGPIRTALAQLEELELQDFYRRITIVDNSPRIEAIPQAVIDQHLRTVRREARAPLFERLEG
jgi:hypothetical protein